MIKTVKFSFSQIAGTLMFLVLFIQTCGIKKMQRENEKAVKSLAEKVDSLQSASEEIMKRDELVKALRRNMYESLVIEEDVDKGAISISEIKKKRLENED